MKLAIFLFLLATIIGVSTGIKVTFYQNFDNEGPKIQLKNLEGCNALPVFWQRRITSLDSHNNCLLVYDKPNCKGRFLLIKASEEEPRVIPNLKALGFNDVIKSVKPCEVSHSIPRGRYRIQNLADGMYMTAKNLQLIGWTRVNTRKWKKAYSQQWDVEQTRTGSYFLFPRPDLNDDTLPYNVRDLHRDELGSIGVFKDHEVWDLLNLHGNVYLIRNAEAQKCIFMQGNGNISLSPCNKSAKNQQWMFHKYSELY